MTTVLSNEDHKAAEYLGPKNTEGLEEEMRTAGLNSQVDEDYCMETSDVRSDESASQLVVAFLIAVEGSNGVCMSNENIYICLLYTSDAADE